MSAQFAVDWIWLVTPDDRLVIERCDPGAPLDGTQHARLAVAAGELPWHCDCGYVDTTAREVIVLEADMVEGARRARIALAGRLGPEVADWPVRALCTKPWRPPPLLRGEP
jgi:hypothetical protein